MFPIYVCYDGFVSLAEREAIERGLRETQPLFGCEVVCYGTHSWVFGKYKSADQLMNSMPRNQRGQVNGSDVLDKMYQLANSWGETCAIVLVTGLDLYTEKCLWCFGAAKPALKVSIQSVNRYRGLSPEMESKCIRRTLRHELGHIFCCASSLYRANTVNLIGVHCTNPGCSMRQTMSLSDLMAAVLEENPRNCFCSQCMQDLRNFKDNYKSLEWKRTSEFSRIASRRVWA